MAALRSCFFSPAFSTASPSNTRLLSSTPAATISPVCRRRVRRLPRLTTAAPPRQRLVAVRAQNRDAQPPLGGNKAPAAGGHFHKEMERISQHYYDIICTDDGFLYAEATAMSAQVCLSANQALGMASTVMDSACLNLGASNEISAETVHGIVRAYAAIFSGAAEDSYRRTVNKTTVASFVGALRGLAAVSYILLEAALEALCQRCPRDAMSEYAFNSDTESMYREFKQWMSDLEDEARNANPVETCKLVVPTILDGTQLAGSFVGLMVARRRRVSEKARGKSLV